MKDDALVIGGHTFHSRFILGSGKYSLDLIKASVEQAKAEIITLALRRANQDGRANIDTSSKYIRSQKCGGSCKNCQAFKGSRLW